MRATLAAAALPLVLPTMLLGQSPVSDSSSPAETYVQRHRDVLQLGSSGGQYADVDHLVITRDVGELTLEHGRLYLLAPIAGRTVGAVFQGQGRFRFAPPIPIEQAEMQRVVDRSSLDDVLTEAILIFSDSTADQLQHLVFHPAPAPASVADHVHDLLASLDGDKDGSLRSDVIGPLLNGDASGFFLARVERTKGGAVLFEIDPGDNEAVRLYRSVRRTPLSDRFDWVLVTQFPLRQPLPGTGKSWANRERLSVPSYRLDVRLTPMFTADLAFAANATLALKAEQPVGPWLLFGLDSNLIVDSARWSGEPASVFKAKDSPDVWVRAPHRLNTGDSLTLTLYYQGNLIDRYSDWFFIEPGAAWYPINGQGRDLTTFDVTYHSPSWYPLASVGERIDSTVAGKILTTRWITRQPTSYATFNLGLFESYYTKLPGAPALDVLISESAHRALEQGLHALVRDSGEFVIPQQKNMRENVSADVANSLKLFALLFGECSFNHFYVTEIPYGEGVSFPGMIDLSWTTFRNTGDDGFDEMFRAHEVAHQWWGNGVQQASYRDKWLSEGLAEFSALWYLQSERKHNDEYFKFLDRYGADIKSFGDDAGPIWIGHRTWTRKRPRAYDVTIYEKGAWVFHMLRTLMLDLRTKSEDRFTSMMRDYYMSYRGKPATTEDFQRVVEQHVGMPMDWFFDEWVKGTGIPLYHVAWRGQPADGGKYSVQFRITQEHVSPDFRMPVIVTVGLSDGRAAHFRVDVRGDQNEYASPLLPGEPKEVKFNVLNSVLADVKMEGW